MSKVNTQSTVQDEKFRAVERFVRQQVGQKLPGERELTERFGISRPRVRVILEALEQQGLVQRRQGSGTYAIAPGDEELRRVVLLVDASLKLGDDPFFSRLTELLQVELQNIGTQCFIQRTAEARVPIPQHDGLLALGVAALEALRDSAPVARPAVALFAAATARPAANLSLLELDDEEAGSSAARRLLDNNVRHVYFFGRSAIPAISERLAGVKRELQRAQVPLEVVECGLNYSAGLETGLSLAAPDTGSIGMIAANDWLAVGLHTGLQSQSAKLRHRVTLVSFDGLAFASRPELGIASLRVPLETMAADAVAELRHLKRPGAIGRAIRYTLEWRDATVTNSASIQENS